MSLILNNLSLSTNGDPRLGSIHFRKNYDTPATVSFDVVSDPHSPTAVLCPCLLTNFSVYATVKNNSDSKVTATLYAKENSPLHLFGDVNFPLTEFLPHVTTIVEGTVNTGYLLNYSYTMRKVTQTWVWTCCINLEQESLGTTCTTVYLLPGLPVKSYGRAITLWDTGFGPYVPENVHYIWTELLDVCAYACDLYEKVIHRCPTTGYGHLSAFTYELNQNPAFHYDTWSGASAYTVLFGNDNYIKLKKYLRDRATQHWNRINCTDCATIAVIEALACGFPAYTSRMNGGAAGKENFLCNPIIAIGDNQWLEPFNGNGFFYHEVMVPDEVSSKDTYIYDACLKLDSSNYPSGTSSQFKIPVVPVGMSFAENNELQVYVPPTMPYTGAFYRERLVKHNQNCTIVGANRYVVDFIDSVNVPSGRREEISDFLPVLRRYHLTDNPLPEERGGVETAFKGFDRLMELPGLHALGEWTVKEDNGVCQVYLLAREQKVYEVSFLKTEGREKTWLRLLARLSCISHPEVVPLKLGDCGFGIKEHWRLFACKNMVIEVASPGYDAASLALDILSAFE